MASDFLSSEQSFAIGEVAVVHRPGNPNHGKQIMVISELHMINSVCTHTGERLITPGYAIDVPADWSVGPHYILNQWKAPARSLRKLRPPREDLQVARWAECPWQPQQVRA